MTAGSQELGALVVRDQSGDGTSLVANEAVLTEQGYVAVYADGGGAPGERLGASELLSAGSHENLEIALEPALTADGQAFVILAQGRQQKLVVGRGGRLIRLWSRTSPVWWSPRWPSESSSWTQTAQRSIAF